MRKKVPPNIVGIVDLFSLIFFDHARQALLPQVNLIVMKILVLMSIYLLSYNSFAQSFINDLGVGSNNVALPDMASETIQRISGSKKIFIITNNSSTFAKGDFVTLVKGTKRAVRAVVAKNENGIAGIKILKIYSLSLWNQLKAGNEIQVLRGDDSFFNVPTSTADSGNVPTELIKAEADLFDETTVLEDDSLSFDDNSKRVLKNDNIISLSLGFIDAGSEGRVSQPNGAWSFQIEDNIWVEASYGQGIIKGYPSLTGDIDTKITNFSVRAKYAITAPFDSYVLPYIGYQIVGASSPGAGEQDEGQTRTEAELQQELDDVESLKNSGPVFGVTALKRLVPGWFVRADLGSDLLAIGFSLEF